MSKTERLHPINTTGGRIQHLRREKNLTRIQFYDALFPLSTASNESKVRTVAHWEAGQTNLDLNSLIVACIILDCDSDYLLLLQQEPRQVTGERIAAEIGLSCEAVEKLRGMKQQKNEYQNELLSLTSSLILSDVPACTLPAILTKGRRGTIYYEKEEPDKKDPTKKGESEQISAEDTVALQKLRAQESLFLFINQLRAENGLDPFK